jgi:hypothetical protein
MFSDARSAHLGRLPDQAPDLVLCLWVARITFHLYRFKSGRMRLDLRFDLVEWCGQDRGLCHFASSI